MHITRPRCLVVLYHGVATFVPGQAVSLMVSRPGYYLTEHSAAAMLPWLCKRTTSGVLSLLLLPGGIKNEDAYMEVSALQSSHFPLSKDHFDMSNSDELRHTNNTTLVPPRLPDTLPQVYHRRHPILGLLILPIVSPFPQYQTLPLVYLSHLLKPISCRKRAQELSAINLDDTNLILYYSSTLTSSLFTMANLQVDVAKTGDPTRKRGSLTEIWSEFGAPVPETS
ncbi:hypothetical protein Tco_0628063 [Tanacetum coccineum]|uniref:Uncharacterized protein n=1 Tax=Tanacetum coccineum TaxID=301880 RepID=A0ABQ4WP83_9ASTR